MNSDTEIFMHEAFWKQLKAQQERVSNKKQPVPRVGLEMEFFSVKNGEPHPNTELLSIPGIKPELGLYQVEIVTAPVELATLESIDSEVRQCLAQVRKELPEDISLIRNGALPNVEPKDCPVTPRERYKLIPRFHDENRPHTGSLVIGEVDFHTARCMSLFSSTQVNMEAASLEEAIEMANRSFAISPQLVALGGNARIVGNKDSGCSDVRMLAWELTHDIRTHEERVLNQEMRTGLPNTYFSSAKDYFHRCVKHPFILQHPESALAIGTGLYWLDTRIKFIKDRPVVEWRNLSTQPTVEEDVAMACAYIGSLIHSMSTKEPLPDMSIVQQNRKYVMKHGLRGGIIFDGKRMPTRVAVIEQLRRAEQGLSIAGYEQSEVKHALAPLYNRLKYMATPADDFVKVRERMPTEQALMKHLM